MSSKYDTASLIQTREDRYSTGIFLKYGLTITRGEGALLWDERGSRYIDCTAGLFGMGAGHSAKPVIKAITEQAERLIACPELFYNDTRAELLEKLSDITPNFTTRFLLCNSEIEAFAASVRIAQLATGRTGVVTCSGSSHGNVFGAVHLPESSLTAETSRLSAGSVGVNQIDQLQTAITDQTAAVLLEGVQTEPSVEVAESDFVAATVEACRAAGALLIFDETRTGFGATGRMFALDYYAVQPDIIAMAGGMAGGISLGAVAITKAVGDKLTNLLHYSGTGGNALASAAACATIDYLRENHLPERAQESGAYFMEQLRSIDSAKISEVNGRGLLIGLELNEESMKYARELTTHGILVMPASPAMILLAPPLTIERRELDEVVEKIALVLK